MKFVSSLLEMIQYDAFSRTRDANISGEKTNKINLIVPPEYWGKNGKSQSLKSDNKNLLSYKMKWVRNHPSEANQLAKVLWNQIKELTAAEAK